MSVGKFDYASLVEAFPEVDPETVPLGSKVLVQIRTPKTQSSGGIILPEETRDTELWNTQIAKVLSVGSLAFKNRDTGLEWPEGAWANPGDFVRVPKHGGDRWQIRNPKTKELVLFAIFRDLDLIAIHRGDPLQVVAFI